MRLFLKYMLSLHLAKRYLFVVCCPVLWLACTNPSKHVEVEFDLPLSGDSRIELLNAKTGKPLATDTMTDGKMKLRIDSVFPMVYLLNISWDRELVNPAELRLMHKYQEEGLPVYQLQHLIYLAPREQSHYLVRLNIPVSQQEIEQAYQDQDPRVRLVLDKASGKNVRLQEDMETLYFEAKRDFFLQKDSLSQLMYSYIDASDNQRAAVIHQQIATLWQNNMFPWLTQQQDVFVSAHPDSPISAYVVYNRVFNMEDFKTYRYLYDKLTPSAKNNHFGQELMYYEKKLKQ